MKIKLIDEARQWYKFASLWLGTIGTSLVSLFTVFPEAAIHAWAILPSEMKKAIPPDYMPLIGVLVFVCAIFAVFVKQDSINKQE